MCFPYNKLVDFFIGCSLAYMVFVGDACAETLSMQEALVELNEAVQFYQVGDRPQALQTYAVDHNGPSLPTKHSARGTYLHCGNYW